MPTSAIARGVRGPERVPRDDQRCRDRADPRHPVRRAQHAGEPSHLEERDVGDLGHAIEVLENGVRGQHSGRSKR
jgi:hypothetical protein